MATVPSPAIGTRARLAARERREIDCVFIILPFDFMIAHPGQLSGSDKREEVVIRPRQASAAMSREFASGAGAPRS